MTGQPLAITSLGMICSVGGDVVGAGAAARAGIVRTDALPDYEAAEIGDDGGAIFGHAVPLADGFSGMGRWVRLATLALEDLRRYGDLSDDVGFWRDTACIAALPFIEDERFLYPRYDLEAVLREYYVQPALRLAGCTLRENHIAIVEGGHSATLRGLTLARRWLEEGRAERVIVLGVDSYVDTQTLAWMLEQRMLKLPDNPVGAVPGDAGACILVESEGAARRRGARAQVWLESSVATPEPPSFSKDNSSQLADRMSDSILALAMPNESPTEYDLYLDLDGQEWRARVWGTAQSRLSSVLGALPRAVTPANTFGITGAASGAISVCLASRAFARGYALGSRALICSVDDRGGIATARLGRP